MTSCFRSPVFQTGRFSLTGLKNRSTELFFFAPLSEITGEPPVLRFCHDLVAQNFGDICPRLIQGGVERPHSKGGASEDNLWRRSGGI